MRTSVSNEPEATCVASRENATHGDLEVLECDENLHDGKVLDWYARALALGEHEYVAKMDQDACVWPRELLDHVQGFAREHFYGGATWRHPAGNLKDTSRASHIRCEYAACCSLRPCSRSSLGRHVGVSKMLPTLLPKTMKK